MCGFTLDGTEYLCDSQHIHHHPSGQAAWGLRISCSRLDGSQRSPADSSMSTCSESSSGYGTCQSRRLENCAATSAIKRHQNIRLKRAITTAGLPVGHDRIDLYQTIENPSCNREVTKPKNWWRKAQADCLLAPAIAIRSMQKCSCRGLPQLSKSMF